MSLKSLALLVFCCFVLGVSAEESQGPVHTHVSMETVYMFDHKENTGFTDALLEVSPAETPCDDGRFLSFEHYESYVIIREDGTLAYNRTGRAGVDINCNSVGDDDIVKMRNRYLKKVNAHVKKDGDKKWREYYQRHVINNFLDESSTTRRQFVHKVD